MRDVDFPQRGPGYLDLERIDPILRDAVNLWIAGAIGRLRRRCAPAQTLGGGNPRVA